MEVPRQTLETGKLFAARYQVESLLGAGAMGKVYLASDTMLDNEKIALKVLNFELGENQSLAKRFLREVQLTRKVTHPNVVRTYDVGSAQDRLYFTMEYVAGQTLRQKTASGPLKVHELAKILCQICQGLAAIHECDIVHRDLKSANVILTSNGVVKISDFGVARPGASQLTCQDELLGSATHMSPEVWRQGDVSRLTDIYALGILAYELATGRLPHEGVTPHELMWKHVCEPVAAPLEVNPKVPRWLNSLILRMLEKKPELRPQSAEEILSDITQALKKSTQPDLRQAAALEPPSNPPERTPTPSSPSVPRIATARHAAESTWPAKSRRLSVGRQAKLDEQPVTRESSQGSGVYIFDRAPKGQSSSLVNLLKPIFHRLFCWLVASAALLGAYGLVFKYSWVGTQFFAPSLLPGPVTHTLRVGISFAVWPGLLAVPAFVVISFASSLTQAFKTWLQVALLTGLAMLIFMVQHAAHLSYRSTDPNSQPAPQVMNVALRAAAVNTTEVALFRLRGTVFVPSAKEAEATLVSVIAPNILNSLSYFAVLLAYSLCLMWLLIRALKKNTAFAKSLSVFLTALGWMVSLAWQTHLSGLREIWGLSLGARYEATFGFLHYSFNASELLSAVSIWTLLAVLAVAFSLSRQSGRRLDED